MRTCKTCGKKIRWFVLSEKSRRIMLDGSLVHSGCAERLKSVDKAAQGPAGFLDSMRFTKRISLKCPQCEERYTLMKDSLIASMRAVTVDMMGPLEAIIGGAPEEKVILHMLYSQTPENYRSMGRSALDAYADWSKDLRETARLYIEKIKDNPPETADLIGRGKLDESNCHTQKADVEVLYWPREKRVQLKWRCSRCQSVQPYPW